MCPLHTESVKKILHFSLIFFGGACLCVMYYTQYYQTDLCSAWLCKILKDAEEAVRLAEEIGT